MAISFLGGAGFLILANAITYGSYVLSDRAEYTFAWYFYLLRAATIFSTPFIVFSSPDEEDLKNIQQKLTVEKNVSTVETGRTLPSVIRFGAGPRSPTVQPKQQTT